MAVAPGTPIDRVRVKNGYGLCTSALSASVIGHFDASSEQRKATNRAWDDRYHKDATFQMSQLEKNHPVRKILHMQKCYPETVRRLNDTTTTTNKTKNASCALKNQKYAGSAQPRSNSSGSSSSSSSNSRWHPGRSPNAGTAPVGNAYTEQASQRAPQQHASKQASGQELKQQASKRASEKKAPSSRQASSNQASLEKTTTHNAVNSSSVKVTTRGGGGGGAAAERGGVPASASSSDGAQQRRRQRRVTHEYDFCRAKMAYNRTKGREAEVDGILTGRSPVDKNMPLFPSRATHQQLLGLTYRPVNPNHPAPEVPRERKWLGDNVGWEGNRGLPTPPAGRDAKDGEIRPWPSTKYPQQPADPTSGPALS